MRILEAFYVLLDYKEAVMQDLCLCFVPHVEKASPAPWVLQVQLCGQMPTAKLMTSAGSCALLTDSSFL